MPEYGFRRHTARHYGRTPSVELVNPPTIAEEGGDYLIMQGEAVRSGKPNSAARGYSGVTPTIIVVGKIILQYRAPG